jgi:short-subunit dehydrogenase involved in D-alanine esterification of teichoic acids
MGVQTLVEAIQARAPELSILINNAAVQLTYAFPDIPSKDADSKLRLELSTNLVAPLLLSAYLLPLLAEQPEAALVNLTSGLALAPKKSAAVYCASKAGLRTFTKALRYQVEDAGWNVRVVEATLPLVDTPMTAGRGSARLKLSPEQVAREILRGLAKNRKDVRVGGVKAFAALYRPSPASAERVLRNS